MTRWVDDLPVRQRVAIRRILAEQSAVCGWQMVLPMLY
jgi:hypothetical protein